MKNKPLKSADNSCCTKPLLKERPLLSPIQAGGLAAVSCTPWCGPTNCA
jgi:hypothetical protein